MKILIKSLTRLFLLALLVATTGCQFFDFTPSQEILLETAVKAGTIEYIELEPDNAKKVLATVKQVNLVISDGEIDLVEIREIVENSIEISELSRTETLVINQLITLIALQIQEQKLNEERLVEFSKILTWIEEAASL